MATERCHKLLTEATNKLACACGLMREACEFAKGPYRANIVADLERLKCEVVNLHSDFYESWKRSVDLGKTEGWLQ